MAQAKKKIATRTKKQVQKQSPKQRSQQRTNQKKQQKQQSNPFFLITMSFLAASLLVLDLLMLNI